MLHVVSRWAVDVVSLPSPDGGNADLTGMERWPRHRFEAVFEDATAYRSACRSVPIGRRTTDRPDQIVVRALRFRIDHQPFRPEVHERRMRVVLNRFVVRDGRFPLFLRHHSHTFAVVRVAPDSAFNLPGWRLKVPGADRHVLPIRAMSLELLRQRPMRPVMLATTSNPEVTLCQPVARCRAARISCRAARAAR
ncbi:MAG: hypothetical protein U5R48_12450 [Gammaproteobacteria bacterium]|nr:hypothetical protein [Gammaproteobacteria bacterium]